MNVHHVDAETVAVRAGLDHAAETDAAVLAIAHPARRHGILARAPDREEGVAIGREGLVERGGQVFVHVTRGAEGHDRTQQLVEELGGHLHASFSSQSDSSSHSGRPAATFCRSHGDAR
jgi:hypothetical protein